MFARSFIKLLFGGNSEKIKELGIYKRVVDINIDNLGGVLLTQNKDLQQNWCQILKEQVYMNEYMKDKSSICIRQTCGRCWDS